MGQRGVLLGGVLVALLLAIWWSGRGERPPAGARPGEVPAADAPRPAPAADPGRTAAPSTPPPATPAVTRVAAADDPLLSAALLDYARSELRAGWRQHRQDDLPEDRLEEGLVQFEQTVRSLPRRLGASLAEAQNAADAARRALAEADPFQILANYESLDRAALRTLVDDPNAFGRLLAPIVAGPTIDATRHLENPAAALADGVTLQYPAGVFRLSSLRPNSGSLPRDVTIAGAGMGATLLLLGSSLSSHGAVPSLQVRDCTVYTDCGVIDFRDAATFRFERVRIVGFDCGAGGSSALDADDSVLELVDCRVEGGYGRHPGGYSNLWDIRTDALLARFERCTFSRLRVGVPYSGATVLFSACAFEDVFDDPRQNAGRRVRFDRCTVRVFAGRREELAPLDLNDLFPGWRERVLPR